MTREQWAKFHHSIRKDARDFAARFGGYPDFIRDFSDSQERPMRMRRIKSPGAGFRTLIHACRIKDQPNSQRIAQELGYCARERRKWRRESWRKDSLRRACLATIKEIRAIRGA